MILFTVLQIDTKSLTLLLITIVQILVQKPAGLRVLHEELRHEHQVPAAQVWPPSLPPK
jgi:hypothetical protein